MTEIDTSAQAAIETIAEGRFYEDYDASCAMLGSLRALLAERDNLAKKLAEARNAALEEAKQDAEKAAEFYEERSLTGTASSQGIDKAMARAARACARTIKALKSDPLPRSDKIPRRDPKDAIVGIQKGYRASMDILNEGSDAPNQSVREAAEVLLSNRWQGYGNRAAMQAMCNYVHADQGRMPFPPSFYDGVMQAGLRAIAQEGEQ